MLADTQKRLEYIHSLQDIICMNYRKMTEQELTLEQKVCRHKSENDAIINYIILQFYNSVSCIISEHCSCFFFTAVCVLLFVFYIQMLAMVDCFIPLLKQADSIVCHRLPSMANALDTMFSFLVCDLKNIVSKATSGPFLDPTQDAKEMVSKLNHMYIHMHNLNAKLEQLSRNSQKLHGEMV